MIGIAQITSNYWYWSYTPTAVDSVRDKELSYETISFMLCQDAFAGLNEMIRARGISLSSVDVVYRAELTRILGRSPVSWRCMIGKN